MNLTLNSYKGYREAVKKADNVRTQYEKTGNEIESAYEKLDSMKLDSVDDAEAWRDVQAMREEIERLHFKKNQLAKKIEKEQEYVFAEKGKARSKAVQEAKKEQARLLKKSYDGYLMMKSAFDESRDVEGHLKSNFGYQKGEDRKGELGTGLWNHFLMPNAVTPQWAESTRKRLQDMGFLDRKS